MQSIFETRNLISQRIESRSDLQAHLNSHPCDSAYINTFMYNTFEIRRPSFIEFLPVFMQKGGNINELHQATKNITIFMAACIQLEVQIVKKMLEYNVDLARKDNKGNNVFFIMLEGLSAENVEKTMAIVQMLLEKDPSLAESVGNSQSALIIVGEFGNIPLIRLVVDRVEDVNVKNEKEETILHLVAKRFKNKEDQVELIKALVEKKVNGNVRNSQGWLASEVADPEYRAPLEELLRAGKEGKKRSKHDFGKEILKSNNKMIKNNIKTFRVNDKEDEAANVEEAGDHTIQYLEERVKALREEKRKKEEEVRRIEQEERALEAERSNAWIISSQELKYYLQQEIKLFSEEIEDRNSKDKEHYDHLISIICQSLEKELNIQVKVYGSFATRLCLAESDIDVVVVSNTPMETVGAAVELLQKIDKKLQHLDFVSSTKFIKSATMPVIKVMCSEEYRFKKIDITLQNTGHNGLDCVDIIKQYMQKYKQLRPLTFVLKTFIYSSNLYDTYQGGLSSYGLILMIVAILQGYEAIKKDDQKILVSELLIRFLWCYGFQFDYINKAIFVESPSVQITRTSYKGFWMPLSYVDIDISPKLFLIDPLNVHNNVGRSTHQIKQVEKAFSNAYSVIHANYSCMDRNCEYRKRIEKASFPKDIEKRRRAKPCCILKRMLQCNKQF